MRGLVLEYFLLFGVLAELWSFTMIKAEHIPDEVVEKLHTILADDFGALIPKGSCRAAIFAALNVWPNCEIRPPIQKPHDYDWYPPYIILPLTQEPRT